VSSGTFSGGSLGGPGITFIPVGSVFDISGTTDKQIDGRTLALAGTVTLSGTGNLRTEFDGTIDIQTGGLFDVQSDVSLVAFGGSGFGFVKNAGTFRGGTGTTGFNGGQSVTLTTLASAGAHRGDSHSARRQQHRGHVDAVSGALIDFNGGYSFGDGKKFTGAGQVRLLKAATKLFPGRSLTSLLKARPSGLNQSPATPSGSQELLGRAGHGDDSSGVDARDQRAGRQQLESRTLDLRGIGDAQRRSNLFTEFDSGSISRPAAFDAVMSARGPRWRGFWNREQCGDVPKSGGTGMTDSLNGGQTVTEQQRIMRSPNRSPRRADEHRRIDAPGL
jgi:hypothetical protein